MEIDSISRSIQTLITFTCFLLSSISTSPLEPTKRIASIHSIHSIQNSIHFVPCDVADLSLPTEPLANELDHIYLMFFPVTFPTPTENFPWQPPRQSFFEHSCLLLSGILNLINSRTLESGCLSSYKRHSAAPPEISAVTNTLSFRLCLLFERSLAS